MQLLPEYEELVKRVSTEEYYGNLHDGITPSTNKIVQHIETTKQNIDEKLTSNSTVLTPKAKKTLADFNLALDTFEMNLIKKNRGNFLQKFIFHSTQGLKKLKGAIEAIGRDPETRVEVRQDLDKLDSCLNTLQQKATRLLKNILSSSVLKDSALDLFKFFVNMTDSKLKEQGKPLAEILSAKLEITDEDMEMTQKKFQAIMDKIKKHTKVVEGLEDLIDTADSFFNNVQSFSNYYSGKSVGSLTNAEDELKVALAYLIRFMENSANETPLTPTIDSFNNLKRLATTDTQLHDELKSILTDLKCFLKDALTRDIKESDKNYKEYVQKMKSILQRVRDLDNGTYAKEIYELKNNASKYLENLASDAGNKQLSQEMAQIFKDMKFDPQTSTPEDVLKDVYCFLTEVFPAILSNFDVVPLPRIEATDENLDLILDNIKIMVDAIVPSNIHIRSETDLSQLKQTKGAVFKQHFHLTIKDIQFSAYNVAFYYFKKTGMIKSKDIGLLDLQDVVLNADIKISFESFVALVKVDKNVINTNGLKIREEENTGGLISQARLHIESTDISVDTLRMKFHNTSQDSYYTFFYPIIRMKMKNILGGLFSNIVNDSLKHTVQPVYPPHEVGYGSKEFEKGRAVV